MTDASRSIPSDATSRGSAATDPADDRTIVLTRMLDAPRALVFEAWTDPRHVGRWWGPRGFTTTTHEIDVRPGGVWRHTMHGPDGTDYPNRLQYIEVVKPERIVYAHDDDGTYHQAPFHVTVTFADRDGRTELTMRIRLVSAEEKRRLVDFGAVEGGRQTLERLSEYVAAMQ